MKLTTERLKQIIREEIEGLGEKIDLDMHRGKRSPKKLKFNKGQKVPNPKITFPPSGSGKEETEAPTGKSGKIRFHKDPKTGKMVPGPKPETEAEKDARLRKQQDLYEEEVDEAIKLKRGDPKKRNFKGIKFPSADKRKRLKKMSDKEQAAMRAARASVTQADTVAPNLAGPTAAPEETEFERDQRQRREQDLYKENTSSLEERIFKMLVAKINGASK